MNGKAPVILGQRCTTKWKPTAVIPWAQEESQVFKGQRYRPKVKGQQV